jgi:hypothetical protein
MIIQIRLILQLFFSVIFSTLFLVVEAQVKDSLNAVPKKSDSTTVSPDSVLAIKHTTKLNIRRMYVGLDPAKLVVNLFDSSKTRVEGHYDVHINKSLVVNTTFAYVNASLDNSRITMNSNSVGATIDACKSLFAQMGVDDLDFVYVGAGLGFSVNSISEVRYNITDAWGTYNGIIPASTKTQQWAQLSAGFVMQVLPRFHLGWRVYGRALLNNSSGSTIAPLFSAPFGPGDRPTNFGYNLMLTYRVR